MFYVSKMRDENYAKAVLFCNATPVDPANPAAGTYNLLDEEMPKICSAYAGEKMRGTAPRNPAERRLKSWLEKQSKKKDRGSAIDQSKKVKEALQKRKGGVSRKRMMGAKRRGESHRVQLQRMM